MDTRSADILETAVRDFIKTGAPVSSERLYEHYDFGIKPARIRSELNRLMEDGYLLQQHISGGRIPTDKGYRFFVGRISASGESAAGIFSGETDAFFRDDWDAEDAALCLGRMAKGFKTAWQGSEGVVYKSGLDELFAEMASDREDWDWDGARRIIRDFESLDKRKDEIGKRMEESDDVSVFIGRQNPVIKDERLSAIGIRIDLDEPIELFLVGPKRMDYERNIGLMRDLRQTLSSRFIDLRD